MASWKLREIREKTHSCIENVFFTFETVNWLVHSDTEVNSCQNVSFPWPLYPKGL